MAYCEICGFYDSENTDGEPELMNHPKHRADLDYLYSLKIMGKDFCNYDWSHKFPDISCMCELCFKAYDRAGKIKWRKSNV